MSNYIIATNGELYHYGIPGMRWGHRKASYDSGSYRRNEKWNQKSQSYKRNSIGRGQNPNLGRTKHDYRTGETAIGKNASKFAKDAINNRNSKNKTSSNNTKEAQKAKANFVNETFESYVNKSKNDSFRTAFKNVATEELSRIKARRR